MLFGGFTVVFLIFLDLIVTVPGLKLDSSVTLQFNWEPDKSGVNELMVYADALMTNNTGERYMKHQKIIIGL